jgi:hypothetical protein
LSKNKAQKSRRGFLGLVSLGAPLWCSNALASQEQAGSLDSTKNYYSDKEVFRESIATAMSDDHPDVDESDEIRLYRRWKTCTEAKTHVDFAYGEFVGFAEGVFNIVIPAWWREHVRQGRFLDGRSGFDNPNITKMWTRHDGLPSLQTSGVESATAVDRGISLAIGNARIMVNEMQLTSVFWNREGTTSPKSVNGAYAMTMGSGQDELYVAKIQGGVAMPFGPGGIKRINVMSGDTVWECPVDNGLQIAGTSGIFKGVYLELRVTSKCCVQAEFFRRRFRYEL